MAKLKDLTGMKYGRLTVIRYVGRNEKNTASLFECICDCGSTVIASSNNLRRGNTKSCGCYKLDKTIETNSTHGKSNTKLFHVWQTMKARCYNPKNHKYKRYGARGISICKEWRDDFMSFYNWSMSHGYADDLTIDRIDNDGNYCPENCRWTTKIVQSNNTRANVFITYNGETHTATEWSRILGMKPKTIMRRKAVGWSDRECIETPVRQKDSKQYAEFLKNKVQVVSPNG